MNFRTPLTEATLLRRYFHFLMEVALNNYTKKILYCPNLGPMSGCDVLGSRVWFSNLLPLSNGYLDVIELIEVDGNHLVSIDPRHTKILVIEALGAGVITELLGYHFLPIEEGGLGGLGSLDILLNSAGDRCFMYIEQMILSDVKGKGEGYFPAVRHGGLLHLEELITLRKMGHRALLFFCVQHTAIESVSVAESIEPNDSLLLKEALDVGVEIVAYKTIISLREMVLVCSIPVMFSKMTS